MSLSRLRGASILPPFPTDPDMWKKRSGAETLVHGNGKQGQETGLPVFCEPLQDADAKQCDYYADNSAKWIQPSGRIEMIDSAGDRLWMMTPQEKADSQKKQLETQQLSPGDRSASVPFM